MSPLSGSHIELSGWKALPILTGRSWKVRPPVIAGHVGGAGRPTPLNARGALLRIARHESATRGLAIAAVATLAGKGGSQHKQAEDGGCGEECRTNTHVHHQ